jgi:hypothetical protein
MKIVQQDANVLVMKDREIMLRLCAAFMTIISAVLLVGFFREYTPKMNPGIIGCSVLFTVGIFVFFFMGKALIYEFDKTKNTLRIFYPVKFSTKHEVETYPLESLKSIGRKKAKGFGVGNSNKAALNTGFDFVLASGERIHGGIYSTNHSEIDSIISTIVGFTGVPTSDSDDVDILWS